MRTHQKPGPEGLEDTAEGMLGEAAGGGRVEQALHKPHAGSGIAGAGDIEDLRTRDVWCVLADSTGPSIHRLPLHFPGVGEGPAGIRHSFSPSLILERIKQGQRQQEDRLASQGFTKEDKMLHSEERFSSGTMIL